jgi:hypothetical protein
MSSMTACGFTAHGQGMPEKALRTKESNSTQNKKPCSRKGAKLAKNGNISLFQNRDLIISILTLPEAATAKAISPT